MPQTKDAAIIKNTVIPLAKERYSWICLLHKIRRLSSTAILNSPAVIATVTGKAKKQASPIRVRTQSRFPRSFFISLKNKLFDVIADYLRFTDKDLLQR